jgi:hypothetical protein
MGKWVTGRGLFFEAFKAVFVPFTIVVITLVNTCMLVVHTGIALMFAFYHVFGWAGLIALTLLIALLLTA